MKNLVNFDAFALIVALVFVLAFTLASAGPPYDITVNFDPPSAGPVPDGYNLYIDDCAATGPTAAAFGSVIGGQTFAGALTVDGAALVCVRPLRTKPDPNNTLCPGDAAPDPLALFCETPDPGPVATVDPSDFPFANPIENLSIQATCPNGGCTVIITVN